MKQVNDIETLEITIFWEKKLSFSEKKKKPKSNQKATVIEYHKMDKYIYVEFHI